MVLREVFRDGELGEEVLSRFLSISGLGDDCANEFLG